VVVDPDPAIWLTQSLRFVDWIVKPRPAAVDLRLYRALVLPSFLVGSCRSRCSQPCCHLQTSCIGQRIVVLRAVASARPDDGAGPDGPFCGHVLSYLINLWLLRLSIAASRTLQYEIRNNYSAVLLQEGVFTTIDRA